MALIPPSNSGLRDGEWLVFDDIYPAERAVSSNPRLASLLRHMPTAMTRGGAFALVRIYASLSDETVCTVAPSFLALDFQICEVRCVFDCGQDSHSRYARDL